MLAPCLFPHTDLLGIAIWLGLRVAYEVLYVVSIKHWTDECPICNKQDVGCSKVGGFVCSVDRPLKI